jgi:hypothetical protein
LNDANGDSICRSVWGRGRQREDAATSDREHRPRVRSPSPPAVGDLPPAGFARTNQTSILETVDLDALANVCGGQTVNLPLSGAVRQNIITNAPWGTQNITVAPPAAPPPKPPTSIVEYMRTNPAARLQAMQNHPVRSGW